MMSSRLIASALAIAATTLATEFSLSAQTQRELLSELDRTIDEAPSYVTAKELRIKTIENTLHSRGVQPERQYFIYGELFDEYQAYNYGKAVDALKAQKELALQLGDRSKLNDVYLKEAMLNTAAGEFLEAQNDLALLDTTVLAKEQEIAYCNVQQRFWFDYDENQKGADKSMLRKVAYYRDRLLSLADPSSALSRYVMVRKCIDDKNYAQADFINRHSLSSIDPASHDYANLAYYQARICEQLNRREEMKNWFIRSAMADIKTATKDNASLFSLADALFQDGDYERAFRYSSFSLQDAVAFDAKLRQWQIASILPAVQKSYSDLRSAHQAKVRNMLILACVLSLLLLIGAVALLRLYRRQIQYSRKIAEMNDEVKQSSEALSDFNERLKKMNLELKEANAAKEEYIGLFLSMCSSYIDKMKAYQSRVRKMALSGNLDKLIAETSSPDNVDKELKEFYDMFDQAFLRLYPKFVEQFNDLLREDARIELKKGKLLNTELRIFALIRLGITQSSDIASMLRYSVNTIYNYRAQIKNSALGDREQFEEKIKQIGN